MFFEYFIVLFCSLLSLIYGGYTINKILQCPDGSERMKEIAQAIQEGAQAYLNRQYITISFGRGTDSRFVVLFDGESLRFNWFCNWCFFIWARRLHWDVCLS